MSDDEVRADAPDAPPEPADECCACHGADLDAEDLALLSFAAGIASLVFGLFGMMQWTHWLALPCGVGAIWCGSRALKQQTERPQAALIGLGAGVFGLAIWLVSRAWSSVLH